MAKEKLSADEKFEKIEFDLFDALAAIDRKDYSYYDRLTPEQQKKFVPFMMIHWISAIKGSSELQNYYPKQLMLSMDPKEDIIALQNMWENLDQLISKRESQLEKALLR